VPTLFDRRVTLFAGKPPVPGNFVSAPNVLRIEKLRIDFKITKDDKPNPNKCEIEVYNLSEKHRGQLEEKGVRVALMAGYADTQAQIFSGDARYVNSEKHGPDWITKFECGDSERAFASARVSQSFGPGTSAKDVFGAIRTAMGVDGGNLLDKAKGIVRVFADGYVAHGLASTELTRLLEPENLGWSMQDGRIEVLGLMETLSGEVPEIGARTGMVGSPEFGTGEKISAKKQAFMKVKTLLQPNLRPGMKFFLQSLKFSGFFKCRKVEHHGSTHGGEFYSDIEAIHA
jgi:hypothetical protein